MRSRPKTLEEIVVYRDPSNPWLRVFFNRVRFTDGREGRYNRIVEREGRPGVAILPLRGTQLGLVRQYRYAIEAHTWEIPRGYGERGSARANALRELSEETGYSRARLVDLGSIHPNSAILATEVRLFAALVPDTAPQSRRDGEVDSVRWFPLSTVIRMLAAGKLTDAFTLAAIAKAAVRGLLPLSGSPTRRLPRTHS